jgi:type VI secretion system protein ImpE
LRFSQDDPKEGKMNAQKLFQEGRIQDAVSELNAHLRNQPADSRSREFLVELLAFSGQFDRAEKQLDILARGEAARDGGAGFCAAALKAEQIRHNLFANFNPSRQRAVPSPAGTLNGRPFQMLSDMDEEIGSRIEVFSAGAYMSIAFADIASVEISQPRSLLDTLWIPAVVRTAPSFTGEEPGQVLIPSIYPYSWRFPDEQVWLGRQTAWMADEEGREYPMGQKLLVIDGEEIPFLQVRRIEFITAASATN